LIFNGIVSVDNAKGIGGQAKQSFNNGEMQDFGVEYNDMALYGDYALSKDCPKDGGFCVKYEKAGLFGPVCSAGEAYDMHAQKASALPMYKHQANVGAWGGKAIFNRVKFKGYLSKTQEQQIQRAININEESSDYTQMLEFYDTTFENTSTEYLTKHMDPPQKWANLADCGEFPCTGPKNTLYLF
jgi:hypothetical protein